MPYEVNINYIDKSKYQADCGDCSVDIELVKGDIKPSGTTPPALFLASIGSCIAVYLERYLEGAKIKFDKFFINVKSDICKESPHYLKVIDIKIDIPGADLDEKRKKALMDFVKNCPIHNTLSNSPLVNIVI